MGLSEPLQEVLGQDLTPSLAVTVMVHTLSVRQDCICLLQQPDW